MKTLTLMPATFPDAGAGDPGLRGGEPMIPYRALALRVVRRSGRVRYQSRWVSAHWYHRYVSGKPQPVRVQKPREHIYALLYLPRIAGTNSPAELRMVDLATRTDRAWVEDISECYAMPPATELTTFFPPNNRIGPDAK